MRGDNNPRGPFGDVVGLRVWRSPYTESGTSQLFIDVAFKEGRLGAEPQSPVSFRMSLKAAEVRVCLDAAKVLRVLNSSIPRSPGAEGKRTTTASKEVKGSAGAGFKLAPNSASLNLEAAASADAQYKQTVEFVDAVSAMSVRSWPNDDGGYSFFVSPEGNRDTLQDRPWDALTPRMTFRDPSYPRESSEPPEPLVKICCSIEDLKIVDIEFKDRKPGFFEKLAQEKRIAVSQYIRQQLVTHGFAAGDDERFSVIVLADASPQEEQADL